PFMRAIDAGSAHAWSQPSIAVKINIVKNPALAKLANHVNKPNKIANPIASSINTIIFCIKIAISGVGSVIFMIHSNQPGILLKIGVAQSPDSLAPLVVSCSHSNGIATVELFNHESSPIPLNNNDNDEKLSVAFAQVSSPHSFANASISQNPAKYRRSGTLQSTFP